MASARFADGARRSPTRLLTAVTVVPPDNRIPLTAGEVVLIAPFSAMLQILFFATVTVVPLLTERPTATGDVAPVPDRPLIEFPVAVIVVPPVIAIPVTVEEAPEDD